VWYTGLHSARGFRR